MAPTAQRDAWSVLRFPTWSFAIQGHLQFWHICCLAKNYYTCPSNSKYCKDPFTLEWTALDIRVFWSIRFNPWGLLALLRNLSATPESNSINFKSIPIRSLHFGWLMRIILSLLAIRTNSHRSFRLIWIIFFRGSYCFPQGREYKRWPSSTKLAAGLWIFCWRECSALRSCLWWF